MNRKWHIWPVQTLQLSELGFCWIFKFTLMYLWIKKARWMVMAILTKIISLRRRVLYKFKGKYSNFKDKTYLEFFLLNDSLWLKISYPKFKERSNGNWIDHLWVKPLLGKIQSNFIILNIRLDCLKTSRYPSVRDIKGKILEK